MPSDKKGPLEAAKGGGCRVTDSCRSLAVPFMPPQEEGIPLRRQSSE
jgi:hypothetical protein